jgi:hypothetical protein
MCKTFIVSSFIPVQCYFFHNKFHISAVIECLPVIYLSTQLTMHREKKLDIVIIYLFELNKQ